MFNNSELCACVGGKKIQSCCEIKYPSLKKYTNVDLRNCSKFIGWHTARRKVFEVITAQEIDCRDFTKKKIIIFGAGSCTDMPIDYICDMFSEVVLVDIDADRLDKASDNIPSDLRTKVIKVVWDITENDKKMSILVKSRVTNKKCDLVEVLNEQNIREQEIKIPFEIQTRMPFDYVISDLILTQIPFSIMRTADKYVVDSQHIFMDEFVNDLIYQHLELLNNMVIDSGKIIIISDPFMIGSTNSDSSPSLNNLLKEKGKSLLNEANINKEMIFNWLNTYQVSKGSNVLEFINAFPEMNLKDISWWWWTYSCEMWFLVVCYIFTKGNITPNSSNK